MDVVKKIEAAGSKATLCQANVASVKDISRIVDTALLLSKTGKIEILVHKCARLPILYPANECMLTNMIVTVRPWVLTQI